MKKTLIIFACALLLAACGKQHKAETIVEQFLDNNLANKDYVVRFGNLGSTDKIGDEQLMKMNAITHNDDPLFKKPVKYGAYKELGSLWFLRSTIIHDKDTFIRTVYLHPELREDGIMAVKEN